MVNTSERAAAQVFGLSLTAVFVGLLIMAFLIDAVATPRCWSVPCVMYLA